MNAEQKLWRRHAQYAEEAAQFVRNSGESEEVRHCLGNLLAARARRYRRLALLSGRFGKILWRLGVRPLSVHGSSRGWR